jgi:hypothetical protein
MSNFRNVKTFTIAAVAALVAAPAHAEIACPGFVMGARGGVIYVTKTDGRYAEYPIIDRNGDITVTGATPYGKVTVLFSNPPTVTWTNRRGDVAPQLCSIITPKAPAATEYQSPEACHDEEYPLNGPYGITGYGHHQVCR